MADHNHSDEPNFVKTRVLGFPARIVRHPSMGHLCGYIKLPKSHPWVVSASKRRPATTWRRKYVMERKGTSALYGVNVHGGVTWAGYLPTRRRDRGYWVGFDCAHYGDLVPGMEAHLPNVTDKGTYRDIPYVLAELKLLAAQAANSQGAK